MKIEKIGIFETKTRLSELIDRVEQGQVFVVTRRGKPVAELRPVTPARRPLTRGCARNSGYWMAPDFDETPDDFADYI
jgi:prevent-host-death family protein